MDKYAALDRFFHSDRFRPGQEPLIDSVLAGRDVLGVLPTGGGKSLCYQLPATLLPGVTLVISPLIALMHDQVMGLVRAGVPAAYLNRSLTPAQLSEALRRLGAGRYRLVYVAPERLALPGFRALCAELPIPFVAVDEAHCISQWGQDFRPDYMRIAGFLESLPRRPVVGAFTATATERVRRDIAKNLGLRDPYTYTAGFDRPNLYFAVRSVRDRDAVLLNELERERGRAGIVYCATRRGTEAVYELLRSNGFAAAIYHAGLTAEARRENQADFLAGRRLVMVATNAFGMGIDKPDVRFVIHYNMPRSLEAYYQEAGRAGRDGKPARCLLLYNADDVSLQEYLIARTEPNPDMTDAERLEARRRDNERLRRMTSYAMGGSCLRNTILRYFGERPTAPCGRCSVCAAAARLRESARRRQGGLFKPPVRAAAIDPAAWRPGASVRHKTLGTGVIRSMAADRVTVRFPDGRERTFLFPDSAERGFLTII